MIRKVDDLINALHAKVAADGVIPEQFPITAQELKAINKDWERQRKRDYDKFVKNAAFPDLMPPYEHTELIDFGSQFMGSTLVEAE